MFVDYFQIYTFYPFPYYYDIFVYKKWFSRIQSFYKKWFSRIQSFYKKWFFRIQWVVKEKLEQKKNWRIVWDTEECRREQKSSWRESEVLKRVMEIRWNSIWLSLFRSYRFLYADGVSIKKKKFLEFWIENFQGFFWSTSWIEENTMGFWNWS